MFCTVRVTVGKYTNASQYALIGDLIDNHFTLSFRSPNYVFQNSNEQE